MRKTFRAIALAAALSMPVIGGGVALQGCAAVGGVFKTDPVGATLLTMKDLYEASVRTAGRLYVQKQISEAQLRHFRDHANKFHAAYELAVVLHEQGVLVSGDVRLANLQKLLDQVTLTVDAFTKK
jgi:hypothetical protein